LKVKRIREDYGTTVGVSKCAPSLFQIPNPAVRSVVFAFPAPEAYTFT